MAVLIPDEKVNCFDFLAKKIFKAKRDNFHPGHLADEGSPFEYIISEIHWLTVQEMQFELN